MFEGFVRYHVYANAVRQALWGRAAEKASLTWRSPGRFLFFRTVEAGVTLFVAQSHFLLTQRSA